MFGRPLRAAKQTKPRGRPSPGTGASPRSASAVIGAAVRASKSAFANMSANVTTTGSSAITSSVLPSRTYGTAPLYVHFDACGTTSSDSTITAAANGGAFRQITHAFDFGDTGAGTWTQTGNSRNSHSGGPITAHVFETPGTYTVNVTHSHAGTASKTSAPITIRVDDPNINNSGLTPAGTNFSGTNTICVSNVLESSGGPDGCAYTTSAALTSITSNRRYLFKRGQTHNVPSGGVWNGVYIGAYGAGAQPIISTTGIQQLGTTGGNVAQDCYIRNRFQWARGQHNLLARCTVEALTSSGAGAIQLSTHTDGIAVSKYTCFFENSANCIASDPIDGGAGFWGICSYVALLGNAFGAHSQHSIRTPTSYKTCIQNNYVPGLGSYDIGTMLKMHSQGTNPSYVHWNEVSSADVWVVSEFNVVSNNIFGSASSAKGTVINLSPQNVESVEDLNDFVFENNEMRKTAAGFQSDIGLGGARMTERGNVRTGGGSLATSDGVHGPRISGPYFHS